VGLKKHLDALRATRKADADNEGEDR